MRYQLKFEKPLSKELKTIATEELQSAAEQLKSKWKTSAERDTAIHEARKSLKKTRALFRLLQTLLGRHYAAEDRRLRDAGRKLSEFRDASVIIETYDDLRKRAGSDLQGEEYDHLRASLLKRKTEFESAAQVESVLAGLAATLEEACRRLGRYGLGKTEGFALLAAGLEQAFRRGRKAMFTAEDHPAAENFHAWRKRVKDHWYHARLLQGIWPEMMDAYTSSLKNLETMLGEDHNLTILQSILRDLDTKGSNPSLTEETAARVTSAIEVQQKVLRENATSLGKRIYLEKPKAFIVRWQNVWNARAEESLPVAVPDDEHPRPR